MNDGQTPYFDTSRSCNGLRQGASALKREPGNQRQLPRQRQIADTPWTNAPIAAKAAQQARQQLGTATDTSERGFILNKIPIHVD
jgi:hypothetical protein